MAFDNRHDQPGRRFAKGANVDDILLGTFGLVSHILLFLFLGGLTVHLWPEISAPFLAVTGGLAGLALLIRGKQVGASTTKESFAAIRDAIRIPEVLRRQVFAMQAYSAILAERMDFSSDVSHTRGVFMDPKMQELLDADHAECHKMRTAAPGNAQTETLTTAVAKVVGLGKHTLKEIMAAALAGYVQGGYAAAIAAVLALLTS